MDLRKLKKLIDLLEESNLAEIEIKEGEESVRLARTPKGAMIAPAPMMQAAPVAPAPVMPMVGPTEAASGGQAKAAPDLPPGHLSYPAAELAVASGVMPMLEGRTFRLSRVVSGAEAVAVIERVS